MKRWTIPAFVLVIAIVGGSGYLGSRRANGAGGGTVEAPATVAVTRGDVQQVVSAPGHLEGTRKVTLAMQVSGRLAQINVRAGERVGEGTVLAQVDTASLELQLEKAEADLKIAQDQQAQAKSPNTAQDVANARARLASAQAAYDKVAAGASQADLAAAQAQVASAQAAYDAATKSASTSNSQIVSASANYEKARVALEQAQAAYDRVAARPDVAASPQAQALQSATIDYQQAKANYEAQAATAGTDAASRVAQATSTLQQAQANLAKLRGQTSEADLAQARATLTQAQNELDTLLAGPDANALDIAQNRVVLAELAVKQAHMQLDQAQLKAPYDGVVLEVRANSGDMTAANSPLIQFADPSALEVVGTVVEEDLSEVQAGQAVDLFFDGQPDLDVKGTVARIVPQRDGSSDRTAYPVVITLDQVDECLVPGMTADASIIIAQKADVLRLPRSIVRAGADGKAVVKVWVGDHSEERKVTVGLRGDVNVEIVDGLREGEQVVGQ